MNAVMTRGVIPAVPFNLLTLLQSAEFGADNEFVESSQGHYYHYLLTKAFREAGVKNDKLNEVFQYCTQLAWFFHTRGSKELPESDLRQFNAQYCARWHTVNFDKMYESLIRARVLLSTGEHYSFRYPYAYYYFKGSYLSDNLSDIDARAYISHCCHHLYVRDHAYTLLFLAHLSNDDFLLRSISEALAGIFSDRRPVTFSNEDVQVVARLVEHAPKLAYQGGDPEHHRRKKNELSDSNQEEDDGLADAEEIDPKRNLVAQLMALTKTTEILGQILKDQYARIARPRKQDLLKEVFDAPLRALDDFYQFLADHPKILGVEVDAALEARSDGEKNEVRMTVARQVVATIVQLVTLYLLRQACDNVSSEALMEDVRAVASSSKSTAYKLIEVGVLLDSPRPIPRSRLKEILRGDIDNHLVKRLIQLLVLRRLYLFKTTEQDMQWLQSEVELDIFVQRNAALQATNRRLLK